MALAWRRSGLPARATCHALGQDTSGATTPHARARPRPGAPHPAEQPGRRPDPRRRPRRHAPGRARLPSTRALARDLGVSRAVTEQAYDQLAAEGWIEGRHGSGTFVAAGAVHPAAPPARRAPTASEPDLRPARHRHPVDRPAPPRGVAACLARRLRGARAPVVRRSRGAARPPGRALHPPGPHPRAALRPRRDPGDDRHDRRPEPGPGRAAARRRRARGPRLPGGGRGDPGLRSGDPRPPGHRAGRPTSPAPSPPTSRLPTSTRSAR